MKLREHIKRCSRVFFVELLYGRVYVAELVQQFQIGPKILQKKMMHVVIELFINERHASSKGVPAAL
jgi:hypothetical protein